MQPQTIQKEIDRTGRATASLSSYMKAVEARYDAKHTARFARRLDSEDESSSQVIQAGEHPEGFGQSLVWDRKYKQLLAVMFVNPQDPLGVSIQGLQAGDTIQVTSASGIASFTKDEGNPIVSGFIGIVAEGAKVYATVSGYPQAAPLIDKVEEFAKDQFKESDAKHKRRDPFGVDPGTGHKARQEGGVLVSLPMASGPYYSGNGSHKERWIKKHEVRYDTIRPDHVQDAFFLVRGNPTHNSRKLRASGEVYVTAWDHRFDDNAGYYKIFMRLIRGDNEQTPVVID